MTTIVTGGSGFLGRRIVDFLSEDVNRNIFVPRKAVYDLRFEHNVREMFSEVRKDGPIEMVVHAAALIGGIAATSARPADFFNDNIRMGINLISAAHIFEVEKFVFVGSVCSYPKFCPVPFIEENLWNGYPEESNSAYGVSKKCAGEMLRAYYDQYRMRGAYVLLTNLYGPGDNFRDDSSHVIPALIRRFQDAVDNGEEEVVIWGTGTASRDFLYVNDAAEAIVMAAEKLEKPDPINIGSGKEVTIASIAEIIARCVGFGGKISYDSSKPDGQKRRQLNTRKAEELLGWKARVGIEEGIRKTVEWWKIVREQYPSTKPLPI